MVMTDPIADYLTRVRNANTAYKKSVDIPASNLKESMSRILKEEGFIKGFEVVDGDNPAKKAIRVYLKYDDKTRVISGLKRISKPSLRVYVGTEDVPRVLGGFGIAVLSTSKGIMTDKSARKEGVGGEVLCYVW
ncbi:30S ribosomal protein S8 [endosymbiont 'TC1' of Trimyema compressum]|uniref:30S ribosomal protein S8 n=1 Tax=endosymbiont 'TC1' of Trimyema compressum TaxID=243899 RepID=UPI0007F15604|nr:30S ribosomal protein S8 [endosymbiont 'TC1' of Trimyema compressum]AMP20334.1 30S ribosomal protein S8 [endosymbiont 'TC1' of Trimyema compressum]